jgi:putative transposase
VTQDLPSHQTTPRDRRVALGSGEPNAIPPDGWKSRGYIPHFDAPGVVQHITFHLADSLPRTALERMESQLLNLEDSLQAAARRKRIQEFLDRGIGSCILADPRCAVIMERALLYGDSSQYRLLAWCIMPNHVHVLISQIDGWPLSKIVQSWKRHSSRLINQIVSPVDRGQQTTSLWQRDYWDRFIRNHRHFLEAQHYIDENPVAARLCQSAGEWRWGSAWVGRDG